MNRTPYEAWFGNKPNVSHLKIFGCIAYTKIPAQNLQKFDNRAKKCIFVGYCFNSKAYRLFYPLTGKIVISRDVRFDEQNYWEWNTESTETHRFISPSIPLTDETNSSNSVGDTEGDDNEGVISSADKRSTEAQESPNDNQDEETPPGKVRLLREIYENCSFTLTVSDPVTFEEDEKIPEWRNAMQIEISAIKRNKTWELASLPPRKKKIRVK